MRVFHHSFLLAFLLTGSAWNAYGQNEEIPVADRAFEILKRRCYHCHGVDFAQPGLNVLRRDILVASRGESQPRYVAPGDPKKSLLWTAVETDYMPQDNPLSNAEKATIREWIEGGAPQFAPQTRPFISESQVMKQIVKDLLEIPASKRGDQKYFTLTHLYNNRYVTDDDLRLYRAALSKAVNSLSTQPEIIRPRAIDDEQTIFSVELSDYGWNRVGTWNEVVKQYPYGVKPKKLDELGQYKQIEELIGAIEFDGFTHLRADWFIAKATRPPLYHVLAGIPNTLNDLATELRIDLERNFKENQARRVGLLESGVSGQNRLIDYHPLARGSFWVSYDFQRNSGKSNLIRSPLGPQFPGNEFERAAFEHAGGEVIFSLPNGLHGYMLVNARGGRIDAGPVDIVWDRAQVSGSPEIVTGLSCLSCHKHGMRRMTDSVRETAGVQDNKAKQKVLDLYAERKEMDALLNDSEREYLEQLEITIGPFLRVGADANKKITEFPEPISAVAQLYDRSIDLDMAACELGFEDIKTLKTRLAADELIELGLGPLTLSDGTVKRSFWDSRESTVSVFHEAARVLGKGTPVTF
jgi:serine/threonine-protein kinase